MKKYLVILLCFISSVFCFAEDFKGFLNIPFGSTQSTCLSEMKKKGYKFDRQQPVGDLDVSVFNGSSFAGKEIDSICLMFESNYLKCVSITFIYKTDAYNVFNAYIKKYNLISEENMFITKDRKYIFDYSQNAIMIFEHDSSSDYIDDSDI